MLAFQCQCLEQPRPALPLSSFNQGVCLRHTVQDVPINALPSCNIVLFFRKPH